VGRLTAAGSALAGLGALHAAVNAALLRRPDPDLPVWRTAAVLVPARDEAARIGPCVESLVDQSGVREVLVLDDGSTDDTAQRAKDAGASVLPGRPLPAGWLGKPHACQQLADAADPACDVLVFVDADVRLAADAVAAALTLLARTGLDLVSPYPRQVAESWAERLVQPLLQWSWLTFVPLRVAEASSRPSLAVANGQFLVVTREAYERAGGHAAVRGEVLDDVALARRVLATGGHAAVVDGTRWATCRMYAGAGELADGYGKSLWAAFGSPSGAAAVGALLVLAYVVPPVAALAGSRTGALGYAAGVAGRAVAAARTGGRVWPDCLAHPASVLALVGLTARSFARRRTIRWKGRPVAGQPR
jgi:hypothetical protein